MLHGMTTQLSLDSALRRVAAPAAIAAACLGVPGDLYHFTIDSLTAESHTLLFKAHGVLLVSAHLVLLVALLGFAARLGERLGRTGLVAVAVAFVGTVLATANMSTEAFAYPQAAEHLEAEGYWLGVIIVSYGLYAAGWLSLAVVAARRRVAPLPATILLGVGALYGFTPMPGSYIALLIGAALVVESTARAALKAEPVAVGDRW